MISHQLSLWDLILYIYRHHIHCIQQHIHYIFTITATVPVSHLLFTWYHTLCIYDISPTIFDTTATASVWSHPLYWSHHKTNGSHHIWYMYDIIHSVCHISFTLYDINPQYLWHHKHCIHDIRSLYDITSTLNDITPLYVWHQFHCIWHHVHCICVITPTLSITSQPLYGWYHIQYICDIISPIFMK